MIIGIVTARGGPGSIAHHLQPVLDRPLIHYPIEAAQSARRVAEVYVSTDEEGIAEAAREAGVRVVARPASAAFDLGAVVQRAVADITTQTPDLDNIVVVPGNTV